MVLTGAANAVPRRVDASGTIAAETGAIRPVPPRLRLAP
jgi:hypothetical protein